MVLAIVGSVSLEGSLEAYQIIDAEITVAVNEMTISYGVRNPQFWEPVKIISGGAPGIDSMAIEVAMAYGLDYEEFLPEYQAWPAFKKRNLQVARACDSLIRIVAHDSKTYGSGWTRDRAKEMGKWTLEFVV